METRINFKSIGLLVITLISATQMMGQNNLGFMRGVVYKDVRPVKNANIVLYNEEGDSIATAMTAINGEYEFKQLSPGIYNIKVQASSNYDEFKQEDIIVSVEGIVINVALSPKKLQRK